MHRNHKKISVVPQPLLAQLTNVRELENAIECGVALEKTGELRRETIARCLEPSRDGNLQLFVQENVSFRRTKKGLSDRFEREYIARLLENTKGTSPTRPKTPSSTTGTFSGR